MAPTSVHEPYNVGDFTPLHEHASQTPLTFFSPTPVLHLQCPQAQLRLTKSAYTLHEVFSTLQTRAVDGDDEDVEAIDIDIFVTSRFLGLYQSSSSNGVEIEYPSIIVHGQQGNSIMLELSMTDTDDMAPGGGDEEELVQIHLIPDEVISTGQTSEQTNGHSNNASAAALYKAIEACQELNPSPTEDDDDVDMPEIPGAGGWITSDNADEYLDEDGQFKPPEGWGAAAEDVPTLGPGAGHTRSASDTVEDETDSKWQRTG